MTYHIKANSKQEAWEEVDKIFPTDYEKDEESSIRAGYPIYRSSVEYYNYICDLGCRLEVNLKEGNTTYNVWIDSNEDEIRAELYRRTKELYPN